MKTLDDIERELGPDWLPRIYRDRVRSQRTRAYRFDIPEKSNEAVILHTLLGVELKVGRRRFACPDLATARYMRVFARIGCGDFALPYDITKISALADELELGWQKALILCEEAAKSGDKDVSRLRSALVKRMRAGLAETGAGAAVPEFRQETGQRKR
jgi:hypothetical protein